jgi:hypothetical protein
MNLCRIVKNPHRTHPGMGRIYLQASSTLMNHMSNKTPSYMLHNFSNRLMIILICLSYLDKGQSHYRSIRQCRGNQTWLGFACLKSCKCCSLSLLKYRLCIGSCKNCICPRQCRSTRPGRCTCSYSEYGFVRHCMIGN